jgi:hypothetical protein
MNQTVSKGMTVDTYLERASNGRKIGQKTIVYLADGRSVKFMEKLTKKEAIYMIEKYNAKGMLDEVAKFAN